MGRPCNLAPSWKRHGAIIFCFFFTLSSIHANYHSLDNFSNTNDQIESSAGKATAKPVIFTSPLNPDCTFENGSLCNWKSPASEQSINAQFNLASPLSPSLSISSMYRPYRDHTTLSSDGHFAYLYSTSKTFTKTAILQAANPFPNQEICFQFAYYFYASGANSGFNLTMDNAATSTVLFRGYGANENLWKEAHFTVTPTKAYSTFTFRATTTFGILALDDIKVNQGKCAPNPGEKLCDFELNATCIFEPFSTDNPTFKVYPASSFGIVDHTTHSLEGHYYGLDLSAFGNQSSTLKRSLFGSRNIDGTAMRCLRFSYLLAHVLPNTTLTTTFGHYTGSGSSRSYQTERWSVAGSTNGRWFTRTVNLPATTFDMDIQIETLGESAGKVLVDDLHFSSVACPNPQICYFEDGNVCNLESVLYTGKQLSSPESRFLASSANFTALTVIYLTDYVDQTWHLFTSRQSSGYVPYDSTTGLSYGQYLLLTADNNYDRGILITERYNLAHHGGKVCFSLAVFSSDKTNILEIYQGESFNEAHAIKIWDFHQKTSSWQNFEILAYPLQKGSVDIFFYIVGTVPNANSYLAIDDINYLAINQGCTHPSNILPSTVAPPTLPPVVTTVTPPVNPNYFTCKEGKVIPIAKTCDYHSDCTGGEDETECGTCYWSNHNLCRYKMENDANFGFKFRDQVTVGPPSSDHNHSPNFLVISGSNGEASLISPIIQQSFYWN